jgi:hypothetical protein
VLPAIQTASTSCAGRHGADSLRERVLRPDAASLTEQGLNAIGARYDRFDVNAREPTWEHPGEAIRRIRAALARDPVASLAPYAVILWDAGERSAATLPKKLTSSSSNHGSRSRGGIEASSSRATIWPRPRRGSRRGRS